MPTPHSPNISPPLETPFRYSPHSPNMSPPVQLSIKIKDPKVKEQWDKIPEKEQQKIAKMILERRAKKTEYTRLSPEQKQVMKDIITEQKDTESEVSLTKLMAESKEDENKTSILNLEEPKKIEDDSKESTESTESSNDDGKSKKISFSF